ncbi:Hypothetical protein FKW44_001503, partial [Caligus rogercresseyi]
MSMPDGYLCSLGIRRREQGKTLVITFRGVQCCHWRLHRNNAFDPALEVSLSTPDHISQAD